MTTRQPKLSFVCFYFLKILELKNVSVFLGERKITGPLSFSVGRGEIVLLSGPNGAGKTSLLHSVMGDERYRVEGEIFLDGEDITKLPTEKKAKKIFLQFQEPPEIEGVNFFRFLKVSYESMKDTKISFTDFRKYANGRLAEFGLENFFLERNLFEGFSGGEKKKAEIGSLVILSPDFALLDEPDSGLDKETREILKVTLEKLAKKENMGILLVSHYRFLEGKREISIMLAD